MFAYGMTLTMALAAAPAAQAQAMKVTVDPAGLPGFTMIQPSARPKAPMPIVLWSNGACRLDPATYMDTLKAIAEEGMLVLAIGKPGSTPPRPTGAARPEPRTLSERIARITYPESRTEQLTMALDWAQRQAGEKVSELSGKLATHRVAMMGHSCGGMHALEASLDPRVTTTVVWSSGYWRYGGEIPGIRLTRAMLQQLRAPTLYMAGGPTDIASMNAEGDFVEINHIPVVKAISPAPHSLSFGDPRGGIFGKVGVAWLRWKLLDDEQAGRQFTGPDCGLCSDPKWSIERKNIP